jgi:hypothetical protein
MPILAGTTGVFCESDSLRIGEVNLADVLLDSGRVYQMNHFI